MFTKMASKRPSTTELNHDNWDEEEQPEEAGTFQKAPDDQIEKRVMKKARRRLQTTEDTTRSAFGTFAGFKSTTTQSASPFSFLASSNTNANASTNDSSSKIFTNINKSPANKETSKSNENITSKKENSDAHTSATSPTIKKSSSDQENQNIFKKSSDYFAKLKGLNESVAQWIKTHVDANPFCILTPIFKDYEKYLKEIEAKHGTESDQVTKSSEQSQSVQNSNKMETPSSEKKLENSPLASANAKSQNSSTEYKLEKSIFGSVNATSKSIFGRTEQSPENNKSIFSSTDANSGSQKSVFANIDSKNIFGSISSEKNPFLSKPINTSDNKTNEQETKSDSKSAITNTNTTSISSFVTTSAPIFCFGQSTTTSNTTTGFSFGSAKPFTFGSHVTTPQESEDAAGKDEEDDEPPKPDFKPVTEDGAIYSQRCKVFIKKDGDFTDRGIGTLFLKPTPNKKTQLIVRAETSLGNLLLNTLLTESMPTKRMNKNTIMLVCLPTPESKPPPVPVLLRVKTDTDADALLETLDKHKK